MALAHVLAMSLLRRQDLAIASLFVPLSNKIDHAKVRLLASCMREEDLMGTVRVGKARYRPLLSVVIQFDLFGESWRKVAATIFWLPTRAIFPVSGSLILV